MKFKGKTAKFFRYIFNSLSSHSPNYGFTYQYATLRGQEASDAIKGKLSSPNPVMIGRLGSVELGIIIKYLHQKEKFRYFKYITGKIDSYWWEANLFRSASNNAGIFPPNPDTLSKFSELMLSDVVQLDILGSWRLEEKFLADKLSRVIRVSLEDIEPFYHSDPWSEALADKTVLVVHPFSESIQLQYDKRKLLFQNKRILPDFHLKTIKAVQSIAHNRTGFKDWFEAFEYMKNEITNMDFDIAIIGCGAYGFPLSAHVKRMGKKAVHLGGAAQLLFGIIGKRWETREYYSKLVNEHWVRPNQNETPPGFDKVESGCYW